MPSLAPLSSTLLALLALLALFHPISAHGSHSDHDQEPLGDNVNWATRHMIEEHHIGTFDPGSFFSLHDYDSNGAWTPDEVRRTYGLDDESTKDVSAEKREEVTREVYRLFDTNHDGLIEKDEYVRSREVLPDFGLGPGHHGDDEYEYEIHHFEKFHDENTREEDLTHPEDIAHFRKHDLEADAEERQEQLDRMPIVEQNIPQKFRRNP
ncbi:MAG: secretory pathway [Lasallia pustulata]|uniref:EF-hand domain pair n=1 Tax=Lasallia pustulata TaxID=136370 RepID=A0A1W5DBH7_9LECA|nr:MAG: secretory pathway [Lasallia pustulata]SLM40229.1 EF-hand domain pair [Lasallia pustulata]